MTRPRACIVSVVRPARDVRTFHREARSLAHAGWDVTVIGRDDGPPATVDGVQLVPLRRARGAARVREQLRALRLALATRADVFQVSDVELLPAALVLRRAGRTVIYDCIEDYPAYMDLKQWIPRRLRPLVRGAVAAIERIVAPRLNAVLTADDGTAERLRRWGADPSAVHNYPRRDEFVPAPAGAPRTTDVVYHGSLPAYHLAAMAEIASRLGARVPGARWAIVGEPDSADARRAFETSVAHAGLGDRVRLRGRVPFPAVKEILADARTGLVPLPDVAKFRVNVPMKLFEYLAAGVVAVASDLPATRTLLAGSDAAILVPPGDHGAFADALCDVLRDPARAAELAHRGRTAVEQRFNWEREERTLLHVYAGLVGGPELGGVVERVHA